MEIEMVLIECPQCHVPFSITREFRDALKKCHNNFYCPKGHSQYFPQKSDIEILQEKLQAERAKAEQYKREEAYRSEQRAKELKKRQAAAKKGLETKRAKKATKK